MVFYLLATLGALTALVLGLVLVFVVLAWFSQPVPYSVSGDDLQRFFSSWGVALGDRGKIIVRQAQTDQSIQFVKRDYKTRTDRLVLRCRNADETRKYFESVRSALEATGNDVKIELTPPTLRECACSTIGNGPTNANRARPRAHLRHAPVALMDVDDWWLWSRDKPKLAA
jgi:hypothetical protein